MDRRTFLQRVLAGAVTAGPALSLSSCPKSPPPIPAKTEFIIDAHCHVFNASDVPIEGFIKNTVLRELQYPFEALVAAADHRLQFGAPDFDDELPVLDGKLGGKAAPFAPRSIRDLDAEFERFLADLRRSDPEIYAQIAAQSKSTNPFGGVLRQAFEWADLMTASRLQNVEMLTQVYPDVALFTPALIDFGPWLEDEPETSIPEQIVLYEKLVRLHQGRIHPLVGFDPLRSAQFTGPPGESPFAWTRRAVEEMGFVGVKLYPPMGFRPAGNVDVEPALSVHEHIDAAMDELLAWCSAEDVPILVHSARTFPSRRAFAERADPIHWLPVLERFPNLRLNLGHFGGDSELVEFGVESWAWTIGRLMQGFEYVFADTAFMEVGLAQTLFADRDRFAAEYFDILEAFFEAFPAARERLLYGSDWHVLLTAAGARNYLPMFEARFGERFPDDLDNVMGQNARRWLGLDGHPSGNRRRLRAFYERHGIPLPEWWIGAEADGAV